MTDLDYRVLSLSFKHKLAHIGSCLGAAPILDEIYSKRQPADPVILSCGHAGLALYVVLEKHWGLDAEDLLNRHGVHPVKSTADQIWCSTGSLGQGVSVAVGRALADRKKDVWCLLSDGECAEGVVYESLRFAGEQQLHNLKLYIHCNSFAAYRHVDQYSCVPQIANGVNVTRRGVRPEGLGVPFLAGQDAHYHVMTAEEWAWVEANRPAGTARPEVEQ